MPTIDVESVDSVVEFYYNEILYFIDLFYTSFSHLILSYFHKIAIISSYSV